ncbi:MAG: type II toxin-antitoxin system VapC family toxin [Terracidiphilus sp.]
MKICADSSFIVSSYIRDTHSDEAIHRIKSSLPIWISPLNRAELAHAIQQYVFRKVITDAEARRAWGEFSRDCLEGPWIHFDLPERTWETSIELAQRYGPTHGVRTLDSLHVACALELKAQRFWTFDQRQAKLAEAVGLNTNP